MIQFNVAQYVDWNSMEWPLAWMFQFAKSSQGFIRVWVRHFGPMKICFGDLCGLLKPEQGSTLLTTLWRHCFGSVGFQLTTKDGLIVPEHGYSIFPPTHLWTIRAFSQIPRLNFLPEKPWILDIRITKSISLLAMCFSWRALRMKFTIAVRIVPNCFLKQDFSLTAVKPHSS